MALCQRRLSARTPTPSNSLGVLLRYCFPLCPLSSSKSCMPFTGYTKALSETEQIVCLCDTCPHRAVLAKKALLSAIADCQKCWAGSGCVSCFLDTSPRLKSALAALSLTAFHLSRSIRMKLGHATPCPICQICYQLPNEVKLRLHALVQLTVSVLFEHGVELVQASCKQVWQAAHAVYCWPCATSICCLL